MTSEHVLRGRRWLGVLAALCLAGCATSGAPRGEREYLDARTAATVTVREPVLVFARARPELAANARDYLTLVPVDVNRAGTHRQYFFGYAWSTVDKRFAADESAAQPRIELIADGRSIPLTPHAGSLADLGLGELPVSPPSRSAALLIAPASLEQQQFVADAGEVRALLLRDGLSERYDLWRK